MQSIGTQKENRKLVKEDRTSLGRKQNDRVPRRLESMITKLSAFQWLPDTVLTDETSRKVQSTFVILRHSFYNYFNINAGRAELL